MRKIFYSLLLLVSFIHANSIEKELYKSVVQWNHANNAKDLRTLSTLYDRRLTYYGEKMRQKKVLHNKKRFFARYPYFTQTLKHIEYTKLTPRLYKVTFDKFVQLKQNRPPKRYPSYLLIDTSSPVPLITEEGDRTSDRKKETKHNNAYNTHIKAKKLKRYFFDKSATLQGKIHLRKQYNSPNHNGILDRGAKAYILKLPRAIKVINRDRNQQRNKAIIIDEIEISVQNYKLLKLAMKHNLTVSLTGEFSSQQRRDHGRKLLIETQSICISSDFD
ncbi:MAG: hypothetical protein U9N49_11560 [Campylobacterota bacterium]|nr:hypothetical protein [Campylobacterota bacterium]